MYSALQVAREDLEELRRRSTRSAEAEVCSWAVLVYSRIFSQPCWLALCRESGGQQSRHGRGLLLELMIVSGT